MDLFNKILSENKVFETISGSKILAFVEVLLSPLQYVLDAYDTHVLNKKYELQFNGQVQYLEHILNDKFDNLLRRIYISEPPNLGNITAFISNFSDGIDTFSLYNIGDSGMSNTAMLYNISDLSVQYDFILNLPTSLSSQENTIKKTCDAYREASKKYQVTYG